MTVSSSHDKQTAPSAFSRSSLSTWRSALETSKGNIWAVGASSHFCCQQSGNPSNQSSASCQGRSGADTGSSGGSSGPFGPWIVAHALATSKCKFLKASTCRSLQKWWARCWAQNVRHCAERSSCARCADLSATPFQWTIQSTTGSVERAGSWWLLTCWTRKHSVVKARSSSATCAHKSSLEEGSKASGSVSKWFMPRATYALSVHKTFTTLRLPRPACRNHAGLKFCAINILLEPTKRARGHNLPMSRRDNRPGCKRYCFDTRIQATTITEQINPAI